MYNGWENYETWAVNLWLTSEENSYGYWLSEAQNLYSDDDDIQEITRTLADNIRDQITDTMPTSEGMFADLLGHSLQQVNWYDVARVFTEEVQEALQEG